MGKMFTYRIGSVVNPASDKPEDYVEAISAASAKAEGLSHLGNFAMIKGIKHKKIVKCEARTDFVRITTEMLEYSGNTMTRDRSQADPLKYDFDKLLKQ